MATKQKASYIALELEWMEEKLKRLKEIIDEVLEDPQDRYGPKEMPNGKVVQGLIISKDQQVKDATSIMEKLPKMFAALDELRSKEEAKVELRGKSEMSSQAEEWLTNRNK